jgi:hypothetical protein
VQQLADTRQQLNALKEAAAMGIRCVISLNVP